MEAILECVVCRMGYDNGLQKPCIGLCGHTICEMCTKQRECQSCPVCRSRDAFRKRTYNYGLIEVLDHIQNKKKKMSKKECQIQGKCSFCNKESTNLAICLDCCLKSGIFIQDDISISWNFRYGSLFHCIQRALSKSICGECSLSGHHYGHHIRTIDFVQMPLIKNKCLITQEIESALLSFHYVQDKLINYLNDYKNNLSNLQDNFDTLSHDRIDSFPSILSTFNVTSESVTTGINSAYINLMIYIIGGEVDGHSRKTVEVYDLDDKSRQKLADLNDARCDPAVTIHNGNIVVYGGYNENGCTATSEEYDFETNSWKIFAFSPILLKNPILLSFHNDLYVFGNRGSFLPFLTSSDGVIEIFDKGDSSFKMVSRFDNQKILNGFTFNSTIFLIMKSASYSQYLFVFNPVTNKVERVKQWCNNDLETAEFYEFDEQLFAFDGNSIKLFKESKNWTLVWKSLTAEVE